MTRLCNDCNKSPRVPGSMYCADCQPVDIARTCVMCGAPLAVDEKDTCYVCEEEEKWDRLNKDEEQNNDQVQIRGY